MTNAREPRSTIGGSPPTRAQLQRLAERRHVEASLRAARRLRFPWKRGHGPAGTTDAEPATTVARKAPRAASDPIRARRSRVSEETLTPAQRQRRDERRHAEQAMRAARRARLPWVKKAHAETGGPAAGPNVRAASRGERFAAVAASLSIVLILALLALSVHSLLQRGAMLREIADLRQESRTLGAANEASLARVERTLSEIRSLQAEVGEGQTSLGARLSELAAAQEAAARALAEQLTSLEKKMTEELGEILEATQATEPPAAAEEPTPDEMLPLEPGSQDSSQPSAETPQVP